MHGKVARSARKNGARHQWRNLVKALPQGRSVRLGLEPSLRKVVVVVAVVVAILLSLLTAYGTAQNIPMGSYIVMIS